MFSIIKYKFPELLCFTHCGMPIRLQSQLRFIRTNQYRFMRLKIVNKFNIISDFNNLHNKLHNNFLHNSLLNKYDIETKYYNYCFNKEDVCMIEKKYGIKIISINTKKCFY